MFFIETHKLLRKISMDLDTLMQKVQSQTTVIASVDTMVKTLAQEIRDAGTDQTTLNAIADALDQNGTALAQVITDGTPAQGQ